MRVGRTVLESLPDWPWTDDDAAVAEAVRSEPMLRAADAWEPDRGNLFLVGDTGVGKTACLTRMLRRWVRRGNGAFFDIDRDVRRVSPSKADRLSAAELLRLYTVPVLVVDDLVRPMQIGNLLIDVAQTRIPRPELTTVIGSMYTSQELAEALGLDGMLSEFGTVIEDWSYRFDAAKALAASTSPG